MSAEVLRKAARLMRERAEAATYAAMPWDIDEIGAVWAQESDGQFVPISSRSTDADAAHIASWHPAVALAVADWLDMAAECEEDGYRLPAFVVLRAENIARAYLGDP